MKHRWRKRGFKQIWYKENSEYFSDPSVRQASSREVKVYNTKECVHCGLRKGYSKEYGFFPTLVYFTPDLGVISTERLPFPCQSEWIGGELLVDKKKKITFIKENEFLV